MRAGPTKLRVNSFVDYRIQRKALLEALRRGRASTSEVCDADPYLLRAARYHGQTVKRSCPVCRRVRLVLLRYVYSDELGQYSGRLRTAEEVAGMAAEYGQLRVFIVEVCHACGWNHLLMLCHAGNGVPRRPPARHRTAEDDYG
jgi:Family of unknown function (DUF5318)